MKGKIVNVRDTCPFPFGRYRSDGQGSGEAFRDEVLKPALDTDQAVTLDFTGTAGYGSSFLDEVFGGMVRKHGWTREKLQARISIVAETDIERAEILTSLRRFTNES